MAWYDNIEGLSQMALPVTIERGKPAPLDKYSLFDTYADAENFAKTHPSAFVGAFIYIREEDTEGNHHLGAYTVDAIGENPILTRLASTSASGDLSADVATLKAQVATLMAGEETAGSVKNTAKQYADAVKTAVDASLGEVNEKIADIEQAVADVAVYDLQPVASVDPQYASQYQFTKDGAVVTTINIPKDQFLKSADFIAAATEEDKAIDDTVIVGDPYLKFEWQLDTQATTYVPVKSLLSTITGDGTYITVTDNKVSLNFGKVLEDVKAVVDPSINEVSQKVDDLKTAVDASLGEIKQEVADNKTAVDASLGEIVTKQDALDASLGEVIENVSKTMSAEINGVAFTESEGKLVATIDGGDIAVGKAIDGTTIAADTKIDAAFEALVAKIGSADTGVMSVTAKDSTVSVDNTDNKNPKVGLAISAEEGNMIETKADGVYVSLQWGTIA